MRCLTILAAAVLHSFALSVSAQAGTSQQLNYLVVQVCTPSGQAFAKGLAQRSFSGTGSSGSGTPVLAEGRDGSRLYEMAEFIRSDNDISKQTTQLFFAPFIEGKPPAIGAWFSWGAPAKYSAQPGKWTPWLKPTVVTGLPELYWQPPTVEQALPLPKRVPLARFTYRTSQEHDEVWRVRREARAKGDVLLTGELFPPCATSE